MGTWIWGGSNKRWVSVDENGLGWKEEIHMYNKGSYNVWKCYYSLKVSPD